MKKSKLGLGLLLIIGSPIITQVLISYSTNTLTNLVFILLNVALVLLGMIHILSEEKYPSQSTADESRK